LPDSKSPQDQDVPVEGEGEAHGEHADLGEAEEEVPATYAGDDMVIGYNAAYVLDASEAPTARK